MQYFGTRLSENISRREPEGYLLCLNVPVARTGIQEYLPEELSLPPAAAPPGSLIPVQRPASEVFSPETVASFEGMPVTDDHPPDGVDIDNIRRLQAGHAHHVRRGSGADADLLLADLIITDPGLIDKILSGKREISCGYNYELREENGQYIQRKIRGNHIAVVDAGRAGKRVSIHDADVSKSTPPMQKQFERRKPTMKKSLTKLLARMARDGETEAVAEIMEALTEEKTPLAAQEEVSAGESVTLSVPENHEITIDEESLAGLLQRLDQLIALLNAGLGTGEAPAPAGDEDPDAGDIAEIVQEVIETAGEMTTPAESAETIAEIVEEIVEPAAGLSATLTEGDEEENEDPAAAEDALRAALKTFRPVLARMTPRERRCACADIAANLKKTRRGRDGKVYAALAKAHKPAPNLSDLGRKIMAARNVNYRG